MAEYRLEVTTGNKTDAGTYDYIYVTLIGTNRESERIELNNYGLDFITGKVLFQFFYPTTMAEYKLEVTTGAKVLAGTYDYIYVTLIGTNGESERTQLNQSGLDFITGKTRNYIVRTNKPLGRLLLVKVEKEPYYFLFPEKQWFCSKIVVTTPDDGAILFPCYRWVSRGDHVELRGGKAMKAFEDEHRLLIDHRRKELELHKELFKWKIYAEGIIHVSPFKDSSELPPEVRFSMSKALEFIFSGEWALIELKLKGLLYPGKSWENLGAIKNIFWFFKTPISEYVIEHWKDDDLFGYQFLNGVNPNMIQRCQELPSNFPVTEEMVQPFLEDGSSLKMEMKKGNIFLCDYKMLEGLPTRLLDGKPLPLTAALCLLYMNPNNNMMPIAIQLGQQPSKQTPIFLPSDLEHDWLLAKIFVKNAEALLHQSVFHLMKTHFLAEMFAVATFRNFPVIHPLYKMLIPHFRYTLQINTAARNQLLGPNGLLTGPASALGEEGMNELMRRALSETTYSSLCLPENITARGLGTVRNFYYRDDGLKLWSIINSFVEAMVKHFYPSDSEMSRDSELQEWISGIFTHGFLGNDSSGIPKYFHTVEDVTKFITMVIFTTSAQHAAVNNGQFDYNSWVPNNPLKLRKAPPTVKQQSSMETILETLPDIGGSVAYVTSQWLLSRKFADIVPLGTYPDARFDEPATETIIKDFQAELSRLSETIAYRNSKIKLPYNYLNPATVENSVSI